VSEQTLYPSLQRLSGARWTEVHHSGDVIDYDILREARRLGITLPSSGQTDRSRYHGAVVKEPIPGLHRNDTYLDFSSLYPQLLRALNASPETVIGDEQDLRESPFSKRTARWSWIDRRPIKRLSPDELYSDFTDGSYKLIVDPRKETIKWRDGWWRIQEYLEPIYFVPPEEHEGILPSKAETYIRWNKAFTGIMYAATKRQRNCFTGDTEVLTPDGVANIQQLDVGDEVYSLDPDTMAVEIKSVTDTWAYPGTHDDLVSFQSSYCDLTVTPDHRMLISEDWTDDDYKFVEADDVSTNVRLPSDWGDNIDTTRLNEVDLSEHAEDYEVLVEPSVHGHTFANKLGYYPKRTHSKKWDVSSGYVFTPDQFETDRDTIEEYSERLFIHSEPNKGWIPLTYDGDDIVELVGWYATEGSVEVCGRTEYESAVSGVTHTVSLAQKNSDGRARIRALLERLGLPYSVINNGFDTSNELLYDLLTEWCGVESANKRLPEWALTLPEDQTELLFKTLIEGDGNSNGRYSTQSTELRDQFMQLAVRMGRNPRYHRSSGGAAWRVRYGPSENTVGSDTINSDRTDSGVYCVTVADNHTLLAGRNGRFQWTGQSLYGVAGWDAFRLFDWRVGEATTIAGRLVLDRAADVALEQLADEYGEETVYMSHADTDGFGISVDTDVMRSELLTRVASVVERINGDVLEEFIPRRFGVNGEHHQELEIESYSPRLFIPLENANSEGAAKKTYAERVALEECDSSESDVEYGVSSFEEIDDDHAIDITGFEYVRSDSADVTADVQQTVLEAILTEPINAARETVCETIRSVVEEIRTGERDLADIGDREGLSKDPDEYGTPDRTPQPQFRGAKYAKRFIEGERPGGGKVYKYAVDRIGEGYPSVYRSETAENGERVDYVAVEDPSNLPKEIHVDVDAQIDDVVRGPLEEILATMGWSWSEAIHEHEQTGLTAFETNL